MTNKTEPNEPWNFMRKNKFLNLLFFGLLIAAVTTGCSSTNMEADSSESENSRTSKDLSNSEDAMADNMPEHEVVVDGGEKISPYGQEQWDLYNGGNFTREDYEQAFLEFVSCVEDNGGWINYTSLDDEVIQGVMTDGSDLGDYCYMTHFGLIDADWQVAPP